MGVPCIDLLSISRASPKLVLVGRVAARNTTALRGLYPSDGAMNAHDMNAVNEAEMYLCWTVLPTRGYVTQPLRRS